MLFNEIEMRSADTKLRHAVFRKARFQDGTENAFVKRECVKGASAAVAAGRVLLRPAAIIAT